MVDSHCHLAGAEFAGDLDEVIARARGAGLEHALVILAADDDEEKAQAVQVTHRWPAVRLAIGVHPHTAHAFAGRAEEAAELIGRRLDEEPLARAVGEAGLDYHYDFTPRDVQQDVFAAQVRLARERRLPLVIHTREADEDTFRILRDEGAGDVTGVFHCFTGTWDAARQALDIGFYISLAGIVTFPRATALQEVAAQVPLDRLLIETDSPYLAPVPYRGRRNEPSYVGRIAEVIAELRATTPAEVGEAALANFRRVFAP